MSRVSTDSSRRLVLVVAVPQPRGHARVNRTLSPHAPSPSTQNMLGLRPEDRISYGQKGYCSYLTEEDAAIVKEAGQWLCVCQCVPFCVP